MSSTWVTLNGTFPNYGVRTNVTCQWYLPLASGYNCSWNGCVGTGWVLRAGVAVACQVPAWGTYATFAVRTALLITVKVFNSSSTASAIANTSISTRGQPPSRWQVGYFANATIAGPEGCLSSVNCTTSCPANLVVGYRVTGAAGSRSNYTLVGRRAYSTCLSTDTTTAAASPATCMGDRNNLSNVHCSSVNCSRSQCTYNESTLSDDIQAVGLNGGTCSFICRSRSCYNYASNGSATTVYTKCGDGVRLVGLEDCDDGNTNNFDGCSAFCVVETRTFTRPPSQSLSTPYIQSLGPIMHACITL